MGVTFGYSGLINISLHGSILILRSHYLVILLLVFSNMVARWSLLSGLQSHLDSSNNHLSNVLQQDLAGDLAQLPF